MTNIKYMSSIHIHTRDLVQHQAECVVVPIACDSSISKIQRKERASMRKTLTDIDGALTAQRAADAGPRPGKDTNTTFGLFQKQVGQLGMGIKVVRLGGKLKDFIS